MRMSRRFVLLLAGCAATRVPANAQSASTPSAPRARAAPAVPVDERCLVRGPVILTLLVPHNTTPIDTIPDDHRLFPIYTIDSTFASSAPWYARGERIAFGGRAYAKSGVWREARLGELEWRGEYRHVGVFAEPGAPAVPPRIYLPVVPWCAFVEYELVAGSGAHDLTP